MKLTPMQADIAAFPIELHDIIKDAKLFDSTCSPEAKVIFIDKDKGYFLKSTSKGNLAREEEMTHYFHSKGLAPQVLNYISEEKDWLLTDKVMGEDCIAAKYLEEPKRLVDILAEQLYILHHTNFAECPVQNHTIEYIASAKRNYKTGNYNKDHFPDSFGYTSAQEAYDMIDAKSHMLQNDTLLHGDYCLPNIILDNWKFSSFIDVDCAGVGDRHVDLFWAIWSLFFNLKTNKYRERFIDAYGKDNISEEHMRIVSAIEVFG